MLPCPYFHVTVTVPEQLRGVLRANQQDGYALLMKAAAHAITAETGARLCKGVAWPARADHELCWAAVSWSLGLFAQELAHEEELAEPAARTDAQIGRAGAGLMLMND